MGGSSGGYFIPRTYEGEGSHFAEYNCLVLVNKQTLNVTSSSEGLPLELYLE